MRQKKIQSHEYAYFRCSCRKSRSVNGVQSKYIYYFLFFILFFIQHNIEIKYNEIYAMKSIACKITEWKWRRLPKNNHFDHDTIVYLNYVCIKRQTATVQHRRTDELLI